MPRGATTRVTLGLVLVALACLLLGDFEISAHDPWRSLGQLFLGLIQPDFTSVDSLGEALLRTVAFAFVGVGVGALAGMGLALLFHHWWVRTFSAFIRAIHELFWALIFLQSFGLHPLTGVLAIAIPYAGIFAKVYADLLAETDPLPETVVPPQAGRLSTLVYARVSQAWPHLVSYTAYRLECGLRSSAVLGFIGMPTIGYHLMAAFAQGHYPTVGALLLTFYVLVGTLRWWVRPTLLPLYLLVAPFLLGGGLPIMWSNVARFFTEDIVPAPLRQGEGLGALWEWFAELFVHQALPGIWHTLLLTQVALVATGALAILLFPVISRHFTGRPGGVVGHASLVILRSTPEYMLAFMLLQLWGPSMLPAVVALALHNGGIIAHLVGRRSNEITLRQDAPRGVDRYAFEMVPRLYGPFLALLFYRWEIILRETAILGILGIATLGFYVDTAIQEIRFDRAMVLILVTALINIGVDVLARRLRGYLRLRHGVNRQPC